MIPSEFIEVILKHYQNMRRLEVALIKIIYLLFWEAFDSSSSMMLCSLELISARKSRSLQSLKESPPGGTRSVKSTGSPT